MIFIEVKLNKLEGQRKLTNIENDFLNQRNPFRAMEYLIKEKLHFYYLRLIAN